MPEFDEEFVKRLGIRSGQLEDLKKQIRVSLEQECHRLIQAKLKEQVFSQLFEQNTLEVPPSMITKEAERIHGEMHPHHHKAGETCEVSETDLAMFNELAKKRVSLGLLVSTYIKQHQLVLDEERLKQRVLDIASAYEKPEEVVNWLLSERGYRANLEAQVFEEVVLDKLLNNATIAEKPMSYAELKGINPEQKEAV